jgi:PAS domain S-box-containing protein
MKEKSNQDQRALLDRITALEKELTKAKEKELKFKYLSDSAPIGIYRTDQRGNCTYVNDKWSEISGLSLEEAKGDGWLKALCPADKDRVFKVWSDIAKGKKNETFSTEYKFRNVKTGAVTDLVGNVTRMEDEEGNHIGFIGSIVDITERNKAKLKLEKSEKKYRELFDNLMDEVHVWKVVKNDHGNILRWELADANISTLKAWGRKKKDIIGKTPDDIFESNTTEQFMPIVKQIFETGKPHTWESYFEPTNQTYHMNSIPMEDYFISTGRDITILKEAENKLTQYNEDLENLVDERTQELANSLERERKLNEVKSQFITSGSHEFRTPLTVITNSLFLIEKYLAKGNTEKQKDHIEKVKSAAIHLQDIVNTFLSFDKLEKGLVSTESETVVLDEFYTALFNEFESLLKPDQSIKYEFIGKETIEIDRKILTIISSNLISNAIKYSTDHIEVVVDANDKMLNIKVIDKGVGIPQEDHGKIFNTFFRASNARAFDGTGLGLNIVKQYIDLMDGEISFSSEENEGSSFKAKLPL